MEEVWKPIRNYEGLYEVSNLGRVKSLPRKVFRTVGDINIKSKIKKDSRHSKDYRVVMLHKDGRRKMKYVHALVAEAFIKNLNNYPLINHKDSDKSNNLLNNLEWSTYSDNLNHSYSNGRNKKGNK